MRTSRRVDVCGAAAGIRPTTRWIIVAVAAFLSLTWQSLVVQTHLHRNVAAATTTSSVAGQRIARRDGGSTPDDPAGCPLCRELAAAGSYLLPTPPIPALVRVARVWLAPAPLLSWTLSRRPETSRSRGPPPAA